MKGFWRDAPGLDEDASVAGREDAFADELLRDGDGAVVRDAQIRQIVEKSGVPCLHVLLDEPDERLDFRSLVRVEKFGFFNLHLCLKQ